MVTSIEMTHCHIEADIVSSEFYSNEPLLHSATHEVTPQSMDRHVKWRIEINWLTVEVQPLNGFLWFMKRPFCLPGHLTKWMKWTLYLPPYSYLVTHPLRMSPSRETFLMKTNHPEWRNKNACLTNWWSIIRDPESSASSCSTALFTESLTQSRTNTRQSTRLKVRPLHSAWPI